MRSSTVFLAATAALAAAQDNTQPSGNNPAVVSQVVYLGEQLDNSCTHKDLGLTGMLGGDWYAIYGDTLYCAGGVTDPNSDSSGFHGMVRDTVARCTNDPLKVEFTQLNSDTPVAHPTQFIPYNPSWGETGSTGFGGTSLCEVDSATAAIFYLVNQNDAGLVGAGVAKVELVNGNPSVTQRYGDNGWWWNVSNGPRYGDVAAYKDDNSNYIYAWGGAPTSVTDSIASQYVYQIRVPQSGAFDLSQYEYWHGRSQGWSTTPLSTFDETTAVMWGVGQGTTYWSPFYQTYFYVHFNGGSVAIRTAPAPEGPWSADVSLFTPQPIDGGYVYAPAVHPYADPSGETLTISYTNNNHIQVIKATFSK